MATTKKASPKKGAPKKKKNVRLPIGKLYIQTTFNNTIVTLTDPQGNKVIGGGTGLLGFKGTKQSTPFAAEVLTKELVREAKDQYGLKEVQVIARGLGMGRDGVFKGINDI
jgi:small subunit ribosomal protein S11